MRPRWHDWVIVLSIVGLGATGVWTIWGDDLARLFRGRDAPAEAPAAAPELTLPPGPVTGPI